MELKDFIKTAIRDISDAVTELNDEMGEKGLIVNPTPDDHLDGMIYTDDGAWIQKVDFNLSISVSDTTECGGGIKINILKAGINNEVNSQTLSSIQFSLNVVLPKGSR